MGRAGSNTIDSITNRQKQYMVGLSHDILTNVTNLNNSWAASGGNFQALVLNAGPGSTRYTSRQEALLALVSGMSGICEEVGTGKIFEPFNLVDSTKTESPFSHNSMTDFTNNIRGAQNVYLCSYNGQVGVSMSSLIAAKNLALDNKIKDQFTAAITALGNVTVPLETAIHTQRTQLQNAMDAINSLHATLDGDAKTFVQTYVTD
jgi:predicted lipoprotein